MKKLIYSYNGQELTKIFFSNEELAKFLDEHATRITIISIDEIK